MSVVRGDGVGIEVGDAFVRAVRLRHDVEGRIAATAELPFVSYDDGAALDSLILLRAELGTPRAPTRIATFPPSGSLQRIDVTGRSGPEMNDLRSRLDRRHGIDSTLVADDGPRRWLLLIRWDVLGVRRLEDLAERAGFLDVTIEPSPFALARVVPSSTAYLRRFVGRGDAHHAVVSNGVPVAAFGAPVTGRTPPDVDLSDVDVPLAWFDDLLSESQLAERLTRVSRSADAHAVHPTTGAATGPDAVVQLAITGAAYPVYPIHDLRAAQRQGVALGAAVGAAGLAGTLRAVDMAAPVIGATDQFDRPWAVERLSDLPEIAPVVPGGVMAKLTKRFRPRRSRR